MADNGHCSICQVQNSASACGRNVQSFKNIIGSSKVSDHERYLKLDLDNVLNINANETIISDELWNKISNILQYLKDYGQIANDNPTQQKINNTKVVQDQQIMLDNYNAILTALNQNTINSNKLIAKELIDNIKIYIKNYQLDATRCDVCNTSGCQVPQCCDHNCCDGDCAYSCGEGGCSGSWFDCSGCDSQG